MMQTNELHCGDNLEIMRSIPPDVIDLIYADPPFFTQVNYGDFDDRFESMDVYLNFMRERLVEMHRILAKDGSIYLHCDWHASAYLKIEMDRIFGIDRFQNEIIWCHYGGGQSKSFFPRKHDTILIYNKGKTHIFNGDDVRVAYESDYKSTVFKGKNGAADKVYTPNEKGKLPEDFWIINRPYGKEHLGYPTQKPEALLERIIKASSNEGDIVLDPFCGCGTAVVVAKKLGRKYIGIDINPDAIALTRQRLAQIITYRSINADTT